MKLQLKHVVFILRNTYREKEKYCAHLLFCYFESQSCKQYQKVCILMIESFFTNLTIVDIISIILICVGVTRRVLCE